VLRWKNRWRAQFFREKSDACLKESVASVVCLLVVGLLQFVAITWRADAR